MIDRAACRPVLKDLDTGPEMAVDSGVSLDFRENVPIIPTHSFFDEMDYWYSIFGERGICGKYKAENRLRELSNAVIIVRKERAFAGSGAEVWDQKD
ncbi:hypothetical protein [Enterocloster lavalensis]|uniref:hypothetical protein n=1 Tax=Enterocloster lavalensis TaxID=460384 RepID=UPI0023EF8B42|nr:hypothetical protein [Enterocloster lavalensis]